MNDGKIKVELDIADIPMLVDALEVARATAAVFSKRGDGPYTRFGELEEKFRKLSPLPTEYAREGYAWFDACTAARKAKRVEVRFIVQRRPTLVIDEDQNGVLSVVADGEVFKVSDVLPCSRSEELCRRVVHALSGVVSEACDLKVSAECTVVVDGQIGTADDVSKEQVAIVVNQSGSPVVRAVEDVLRVWPIWSPRTGSGRVEVDCLILVSPEDYEAVSSQRFSEKNASTAAA